MNIISLGAGVQSSTMALMAEKGEITPMPDCAIFADTGWEPKRVYEWLDWLETQLSFPVYRVINGAGLKDQPAMIPFFIKSGGMLKRSCTEKYKIRPVMRKVRELMGLIKGQRSRTPVNLWIGISTDEAIRMKPAQVQYVKNIWPLIDAGMTRQNCLSWMKKNNYPMPGKSSCIVCPYHDDKTWREMKINEPEEFSQAVKYDVQYRNEIEGWAIDKKDLRKKDEGFQVFLHRSLKPLGEIDFRNLEDMGQQRLEFGEECEGMCGV